MPTRKLSALIIDNAGLTALSRATQCIAALQRLYTVCAPPDMVRASRVVNNRDGMLVIAADNGAIAAKLRQQAPRNRAKKPPLTIDSIDNFETLSKQVKDPDLSSALARFAARRRQER
jgi:hypothetical protein